MGLLALIGIGILTLALDGFVFACLWGWFIVPLGLPIISFLHSMGIVTIIELTTHQYTKIDKDDTVRVLLIEMIVPLVMLIVGFVLRLLM